MRPLHHFLTALGFMTRIGPARGITPQDIAPAMAYLPLTGLVIGLLTAAPIHFGLLENHPWTQAWLAAIIATFLTRALHWDGWADVWDGWGSGATDDRFWEIVKDSHVGAFGVIGLLLGLGGQILLLHEVLITSIPTLPANMPGIIPGTASIATTGTVAFCFVMGRTAAVFIAAIGKKLARPGLGQAFLQGATPKALAFATITCLASAYLLTTLATLAWAAALSTVCIAALLRLARRQNGLNGDFLGCTIISCELATLLGYLLASY